MNIGYIYILTCKSNKVYVGSTKNINQRFIDHKNFNNNKHNSNSKLLFLDGDVNINILEEVNYEDKIYLLEREKYWIDNYKNISNLICVNKKKPYRTKEELKIYTKEYKKMYFEKNKDIINLKNKEYREKNKDKIKLKKKEYAEKNKDYYKTYNKQYFEKNKDYFKEYYQKNRDKINQKITCEICNCEINKKHLNTHYKTKKHMNNLNK